MSTYLPYRLTWPAQIQANVYSFIATLCVHTLILLQPQNSFVKPELPFVRVDHGLFFSPTVSFARVELVLYPSALVFDGIVDEL